MVRWNGLNIRRLERKKGITPTKTKYFYMCLEKDNKKEDIKRILGRTEKNIYISSEYVKNNIPCIEYNKIFYNFDPKNNAFI